MERSALLSLAQAAAPGKPCRARAAQHGKSAAEVLLTSEQRQHLLRVVGKEHWSKLSEEHREIYITRQSAKQEAERSQTLGLWACLFREIQEHVYSTRWVITIYMLILRLQQLDQARLLAARACRRAWQCEQFEQASTRSCSRAPGQFEK